MLGGKDMRKTVVELFAGVGGFRVGLEKSSREWDFVWANQWEPLRKAQDAYKCYVHHFGESERHVNVDINEIEKKSIPDHNLLVGGFPCQDYSVASTGAKGIQGKKGVLWWNIFEILKAKNPAFVLLENVDRLLKSPSSQRGRDFGIMLSCLKELGYGVEWRVINAAEYGLPQRRRRVFIFAFRNDTKYYNDYKNLNFRECIHSKGFFYSQFPISDEDGLSNQCRLDYKNIIEVSNQFSFKFMNSGVMINGYIYTESVQADYNGKYGLLRNILEGNVDSIYYLNGELGDWKYMKGAKKIERVSKTGHKYIFSEGKIAFPDPIDKPSRTMLTSEASKNRSTHIVNDPHTGKMRKLTPLECERLNGFPDNWTDTGMSERFRYFCMGNALIVNLVELMGKKLNKIIDYEE